MGKDALELRKSLETMSLEKEWAAFPRTIKNPRARINVKSWLDRYCWTLWTDSNSSNHIVGCILIALYPISIII
jgi:hypothetical protein